MSTTFRHVANRSLRRTLEAKPDALCPGKLQRAVGRTLEALGADVIDDSIPETALHYRVDMAREARVAIRRQDLVTAHAALQQFWLT